MRVLVLPADMAGCGFYRLTAASEYLQSQGHDIHIQYPDKKDVGLHINYRGDVNDPGAEIIDVIVPHEADVLVMQRLSHNWHSKIVKKLRDKGLTVIIDMDDDLSSIHPDNKAFREYHPRSNTPYSWKNVEQACRDATLVTTSTPALLNVYAKHGRGIHFDNFVPQRYLNIAVNQDEVFGWPGTTDSHPNDLQVTGDAVRRLTSEGYKFRVVGPPSQVKNALRLPEVPSHTGIVQLFDWPSQVGRLQVTLAPLAPTQFNTCKSRLKLVEANSVGVPYVASPRAEYARWHKTAGAGLLADGRREWYSAVKRLMDDETLRKELGEAGREAMRSQTIEGNAWRLLEAWQTAYDIQHGRRQMP